MEMFREIEILRYIYREREIEIKIDLEEIESQRQTDRQ